MRPMLTLWTWSNVVRRLALAAEASRFMPHTTRHLCLTDLARMGWEPYEVASLAGHRSTEPTLGYGVSGRALFARLNASTSRLYVWRVDT